MKDKRIVSALDRARRPAQAAAMAKLNMNDSAPADARSAESGSTDSPTRDPSHRPTLEDTIRALCVTAGSGKTICPTDAAKAFASARGEDDLGWRNWLQKVRGAAVGMARKGDIVIYRKGKPADPDDFRGVYRLGMPRSD